MASYRWPSDGRLTSSGTPPRPEPGTAAATISGAEKPRASCVSDLTLARGLPRGMEPGRPYRLGSRRFGGARSLEGDRVGRPRAHVDLQSVVRGVEVADDDVAVNADRDRCVKADVPVGVEGVVVPVVQVGSAQTYNSKSSLLQSW